MAVFFALKQNADSSDSHMPHTLHSFQELPKTLEEIATMHPHRPTQDQIRLRAYQIYLEHGFQDGHDIDDWLTAERELSQD